MSDINARIQGLIDAHPVFLFMKGTPTFPQCGFSATVISILDHMGVDVRVHRRWREHPEPRRPPTQSGSLPPAAASSPTEAPESKR